MREGQREGGREGEGEREIERERGREGGYPGDYEFLLWSVQGSIQCGMRPFLSWSMLQTTLSSGSR